MEWINRYPRWNTLLEVNPRSLIRAEAPFEPSAQKLELLLKKFRQDGEMDAPILARGGAGICFVDGRHRTLAAIMVGLPTIKIAVLTEEIGFIQGFLREDK